MKVIFLDIDGVMNCWNKGENWSDRKDRVHMIHDDLVARLNRILDATGAKIVLSSTWRKAPDWHQTMIDSGIRDVFLGRTISLSMERCEWEKANPGKGGVDFMERGKEIQAWLDEWQACTFPNCPGGICNENVERYCILDDDSDMMPHQKHFKTSGFEGGLTDAIADEVIAYLNNPHS